MLDGQPVGHRNRNMPIGAPLPAAAARRQALDNLGGSGSIAAADLQPLFLPRDATDGEDSGGAVIGICGLKAEEQAAVAALQRSGHADSHSIGNYQASFQPSTGASNAQLRTDALERLLGGPAAGGGQDSNCADADGNEQEHTVDSAADGNASDSGAWTPAALPPPAQHQQRRQQRKPRSSSMSVRPAALPLGAADLLVRPILGARHLAPSRLDVLLLQTCNCILASMQSPCNSDQHRSNKQWIHQLSAMHCVASDLDNVKFPCRPQAAADARPELQRRHRKGHKRGPV